MCLFGDITTKCWQLECETMADVLKSLNAAGMSLSIAAASVKTAGHLKKVFVADE
jgi:hypothetical protein